MLAPWVHRSLASVYTLGLLLLHVSLMIVCSNNPRDASDIEVHTSSIPYICKTPNGKHTNGNVSLRALLQAKMENTIGASSFKFYH
ncbi:hypothetical protein BDV36DRAFT_271230, partial [Aspergillus pseudocaelatus]